MSLPLNQSQTEHLTIRNSRYLEKQTRSDIIDKKDGFTLIELMIVIAIISILVAIAIPTFLEFQIRAQQTEVKVNLGALGATAEAYKAENDTYVADIDQLGWDSIGTLRYDYGYNLTSIDYVNSSNTVAFDVAADSGAATQSTFLAAAEGDVDLEPTGEDCWTIDQNRDLVHVNNDRAVDTAC